MANKGRSQKKMLDIVYSDDGWVVKVGRLKPKAGRPHKTGHLFEIVAEKLPFECLSKVRKVIVDAEMRREGVYMAHDSMGVAGMAEEDKSSLVSARTRSVIRRS